MKKTIALLLTLLLFMQPLSSLAAPARDMGAMDMPVNEPLQHMLNLIFSAAMIEGTSQMDTRAGVPTAVQDTLFALFHYVEGGEAEAVLTAGDAENLYRMFFAGGKKDVSFENGKTLSFARFDEMPLAGAYVYEAVLGDEGTLAMKADLYTLWGYFSTPAEFVPEGDLTWWAGADVVLVSDETSPYGYVLESFVLTEAYMDGLAADWQLVENADMEYSLRLPSILGLAEDEPGRTVYQTADGACTVTITCTENGGYDAALSAAQKNYAHLDFTEEQDRFTFTALGEGQYLLCVAADGLPYAYTLDMTFPAGRQQEFTLYADLIRNSLAVWGLNNG